MKKRLNLIFENIAKKLNLKEQIYVSKSGAVEKDEILDGLLDAWSIIGGFFDRLKREEVSLLINEVKLSLEEALKHNPIFKETFELSKEIKEIFERLNSDTKLIVKKLDTLIDKLDTLFKEEEEEEEEEEY